MTSSSSYMTCITYAASYASHALPMQCALHTVPKMRASECVIDRYQVSGIFLLFRIERGPLFRYCLYCLHTEVELRAGSEATQLTQFAEAHVAQGKLYYKVCVH